MFKDRIGQKTNRLIKPKSLTFRKRIRKKTNGVLVKEKEMMCFARCYDVSER